MKKTPERRRNRNRERQVEDHGVPWKVEEATSVLAAHLIPQLAYLFLNVYGMDCFVLSINPIYLKMSEEFLFLITKELQLRNSHG